MFEQRLTGAQAWERKDLTAALWQVQLDEDAVEEILATVRALRAQPVPLLALRPDSFPMPACERAMARVAGILEDGVRFAVLRGLPVEQIEDDEARCIYWMLGAMLARPVAQKLDGTMIYDVTDTGALPLPGSGVRPDKSNVELLFHNDNAYNRCMPEIVGLLCIRPAVQGGRSRVMSFATAHNALRERHPEALPRLYRPFVFDRQKEFAEPESPLFEAPVFSVMAGRLGARLGLHQVRNGYALKGGMDDETARALEAVEAVFADETLQFEFDMQPGDVQFARNRELGHSRTAFSDAGDPASRRLMVRLWLRDEGTQGYMG